MDRLFEFVVNHYILVSLFVALLAALFVLETRRGGAKVSPQAAVNMMNHDEAVIVDVRDRKDQKEGRIAGSLQIPLHGIKDHLSELKKHQDKQIIVVDKAGQHSAMAIKQLKEEGFTNVSRLSGGMMEWKASNLPLVKK
jgi:rhodanese-related sulfurtransferase